MGLKITGRDLERVLGNGREEIGYVNMRDAIPFFDCSVFTYFDDQLVSAVYRNGGENGEIVASIKLSYDPAGLLQSIERLDP